MKIAHIVGNRPQFVKLSLLYRAWARKSGDRPLIIHTGQHFSDNMSGIFFRQCGIPDPDHQLQINTLPHNEMIGRMLAALDPILANECPDGVVVYGDTNTTLAGALAAKKRNIPLAHVESGIRTGKEDMPEESNRYVTDRLADLNFACTYLGVENLVREGFTLGDEGPGGMALGGGDGAARGRIGRPGVIAGRVFNTGDLMLDAALLFKDEARQNSLIFNDLSLSPSSFVLATIHRAENAEDPAVLGSIIQALNIIHTRQPVVFPVHPKTRQLIDAHGLPVHFITTPPLSYLDMLALVQTCRYVITDSGGLSREAFFFSKPTLVVMQNPFWPELLLYGRCLQAQARCEDILEKAALLFKEEDMGGDRFKTNIFGDGNAADKITEILLTAWSS